MLYVWGVADLLGAEVLVRIEDHDRQRSRHQYEEALLGDMDWLGFCPSNRLEPSGSNYRQSDCNDLYEAMLRDLARCGHVYRCRCSRKQLVKRQLSAADGERAYPGTCRNARHTADAPHGLRLAWAADATEEAFCDGLLGPQRQKPELQCGDLLLRDRTGNWTYQFAVAADDFRHGVDIVVRGRDLLASTGRQVRLARMLGRAEPPLFFHHPLVRDLSGTKLSKSERALAVRDLRQAGWRPSTVLGKAAQAVGLPVRTIGLHAREAADLVRAAHPGAIARLSRPIACERDS